MTLSPAERQAYLDDQDRQDCQDAEDPMLARMRALARYRDAHDMTARQHMFLLESKGRFDLAALVRESLTNLDWAKVGA